MIELEDVSYLQRRWETSIVIVRFLGDQIRSHGLGSLLEKWAL